jgi:hypothetical protein
MIKTTTAIILSLVCAVSYQGLEDEIEVKSLNRFVDRPLCIFHPILSGSNQATVTGVYLIACKPHAAMAWSAAAA